MVDFNPKMLKVRFILPASPTEPLKGRKYTLTYSVRTNQHILDIGTDFNYEAVTEKLPDGIIIEWQNDWQYRLAGRVFVDRGEYTVEEAEERFNQLRNKIANGLQGVAFGDRLFLSNYPLLLDAPIYFFFESNYSAFKQCYYYGTLKQYLNQFQYEI